MQFLNFEVCQIARFICFCLITKLIKWSGRLTVTSLSAKWSFILVIFVFLYFLSRFSD